MRLGSRKAGYTLVELMVVVAIIGLSALAFAPAFSKAMADRETSFATRELVRIGKRARAEASGYLLAYMVWIQPDGGTDGEPRIQLLRGVHNSCIAQAWSAVPATCGAPNSNCLEDVDFGQRPFLSDTYDLRFLEEAVGGATAAVTRALCYAPNGVLYTGSGGVTPPQGTALAEANNVSGGIVYAINLERAGAVTTATRRVLFPFGTSPMVMR